MRPIQIRKREQLPKEFSLEKYKQTENFNIQEWAIHLERRVFCRMMLGKGDKRFLMVEEARPYVQRLIEEPIVLKNEKNVSPRHHTSHIWDFSVTDAYYHGPMPGNEKEEKFINLFHKLDRNYSDLTEEELSALEQPHWKMLQEIGIDDECRVSIMVDLLGSEAQILNDFKKWLRKIQEIRKVQTPKERITPDDLANWHKYAVLPYLDLTSWAAAQGAEISQPVLGRVLFPNEHDVDLTERIRKVVLPYAQKIGNSAFSSALTMQADADSAESNHEDFVPGA